MTRGEIEPMVPRMPRDDDSPTVRADGGTRKRYDAVEIEAALVADLR